VILECGYRCLFDIDAFRMLCWASAPDFAGRRLLSLQCAAQVEFSTGWDQARVSRCHIVDKQDRVAADAGGGAGVPAK